MGQKRLESAIKLFHTKHSNVQIDVEWKPYMIDPSIAIDGVDMEEYCTRRWGSSNWTNRLREEGRKSGAPFENWKWIANTMKSHRLVKFANERYGVDTGVANSAIFKALYEEGKNISLVDALVDIGRDLNLQNENELREFLESDEGENEVKAEIEKGRRTYKISGVPFFVIEPERSGVKPYGLSGAQEKETFLEIFEEFSEGL